MISESCKQEIVRIARNLYQRQMVNTNEGNVSLRDGDLIYITPSQVCKGELTTEMVVVTDLAGNQLGGDYKASSEILLHLHLYMLRPDLGGVVHDHSPFATAFAIARQPIASCGYSEMIYFYDQIPVVQYGTPGTPQIIAGIEKYVHQTDVFLLANHGLVAMGKDVSEAYLRAESAESIAKTLILARLLGGEDPIGDSQLDELYEQRRTKLGKGRILL